MQFKDMNLIPIKIRKDKRFRLAVVALAGVLVLTGITASVAGIARALRSSANAARGIVFLTPQLTGKDAVLLPASGSTMRDIRAQLYDRDGNPQPEDALRYELDKADVPGVRLEGNRLHLDGGVIKDSMNLRVTATEAGEPMGRRPLSKSLKIQIKTDTALKDVPPNEPEKEGWILFYRDEFEGDTLNTARWSPYYLRHWTDYDGSARASYALENGVLALSCEAEHGSWSPQDPKNVSGLVSFERNHLHKFGELGRGAVYNREIPLFDGFATKYGYFEVRMRMPDTGDGSHFAWWMVGTQDDMNVSAMLEGDTVPYQSHYTNQAGEIDILENALGSLKQMKAWRPVIHPNGTTDYEYYWVPEHQIPGDPSREYHIYAMEWDESGTKFYVDNQLTETTTRSPSFRMMTIFSVYAEGGMGKDRGIYPKTAYIDYFRVYKRDKAPRAGGIVLNRQAMPDYVQILESGVSSVRLGAQVLDQFDKPFAATVKWKFSETIDGFAPESSTPALPPGVSLDENTGLLEVHSYAKVGQDLFVTAFVDDTVKQSYHIKLSAEDSAPRRVLFRTTARTIRAGGSLQLEAALCDQYNNELENVPRYQLSADISGAEAVEIKGVSLSPEGLLKVETAVPAGTVLIVSAKAGGKYGNLILTVT